MALLKLALFTFSLFFWSTSCDTSDRRLPAYITGNRHGPTVKTSDNLNRHDSNQLNGQTNAVQPAVVTVKAETQQQEQPHNEEVTHAQTQALNTNDDDDDKDREIEYLEDAIANADEEIEELREEFAEHEEEEAIEDEIRDEEMAYYAYDNFERGYDDGYYDGSYYQPSTYGLSFMHFIIVGLCVLGSCAALYLGAGGCIMAGYYAGKQGYMQIDGDDDVDHEEKESLVVETKE